MNYCNHIKMMKIGTNLPKNHILFGAEIPSRSSAFSKVMLNELTKQIREDFNSSLSESKTFTCS